MLEPAAYLDRYPKELSGGQRQRVAMGRAMVRDASGLPVRRAAVEPGRQAARPYAHRDPPASQPPERPRSTSPNDQIEAMTMADKISWSCAPARSNRSGSPDDVYDRLKATYVADFIGSPGINFLNGMIPLARAPPSKPRPGGCRWAAMSAKPGQQVIGLRPTGSYRPCRRPHHRHHPAAGTPWPRRPAFLQDPGRQLPAPSWTSPPASTRAPGSASRSRKTRSTSSTPPPNGASTRRPTFFAAVNRARTACRSLE